MFDEILEYPMSLTALREICSWGDSGEKGSDTVGRRFCCAAAYVGLPLLGLIEAVATFALALLTSPLYFFGNDLPEKLLRNVIVGLIVNSVTFTLGQYFNATSAEAALKIETLLESILGER